MGFRSALFFLGIGASLPPLPASSVTSAHVQVLVASPAGLVIGELRTRVEAVSWQYRGEGEAVLPVGRTAAMFSEEMLGIGNRVLMRFSNGLPDWGGIIAAAPEWDVAGVMVTVAQAKRLFSRRKTGWLRKFVGVTGAAVFRALIEEANARAALNVLIGTLPAGGSEYDLEYGSEFLGDVFDDLVELYDADDWDVTAELGGGRIEFTAQLYSLRGQEKPNVALNNGRRGNVGAVRYREEGEIVNAWHLAGAGKGWGESDRPYAFVTDEASISRHGYSEDSLVVDGATSATTLYQAGQKLLRRTAWPRALMGLEAADRSPGRFEDYDVGDSVTAQLWNYGFGGLDALARLIGRSYSPERGTCELALEEVV